MQPFNLARQLKKDFLNYVSSKFPFAENGNFDLDLQLRQIMEKEGALFQDPVIQLVRSRTKAEPKLEEFHPILQTTIKTLKELKTPYSHQVQAWNRINNNKGTVISTGTGSGKSESFILPVINGLLQKGYGTTQQGIGAILVYPMNALVHDQFYRIIKYAAGTGIRVGIYNGAFKDLKGDDKQKIIDEIKEIRAEIKKDRPDIDVDKNILEIDKLVVDPSKPETIPHILLTNYKMLEYMLLRSSDQKLFESMNLHYLALDEAHTYTGTLALEVACLLNRLKVHLGDNGKNFVPIATSATLSQGPDQDERKVEIEMKDFFSKLFGRSFEGDDWLLKDSYVKLEKPDIKLLKNYLNFDNKELKPILEKQFPEALFELANHFFKIKDISYENLTQLLFEETKELSSNLLSVLLQNDDGTSYNMVTWNQAIERFNAKTSGSASLLEALLILCSHAYENKLFPNIGVRYHLFGRAQPRIYWSLDKKKLFDDSSLIPESLNYVSCRKCGHSAYAGLLIPVNSNGGEKFEIQPLPERFDEELLSHGTEAAIFHHINDIPNQGQHLPNSWEEENYSLTTERDKLYAHFISEKQINNSKIHLVRYTRKDTSDFFSCPACASTGRTRPVINSHRSSASIDLSVHTASLLSRTAATGIPEDDNKERKLLVFCDNRQETSFLAGFLTDRHRRLNLRRAIASYLHEAQKQNDTKPWLVKKSSANQEALKYDFALRLLISLKLGSYFDRTQELPKSFVIEKSIIQNLLPREVLETYSKLRQADERKKSLREWLLDNFSKSSSGASTTTETFDLVSSDNGLFVLEILTDVIALDLTNVQVKEGNLSALGIATWDYPNFNKDDFKEFSQNQPDLGLEENGYFAVSNWLLDKLADHAAISDVDLNTTYQFLNRLWNTEPRPTLKFLLGEGATRHNRITPSSTLGCLLSQYSTDNQILNIWSKKETWQKFIKNSPINKCVFLSDGDNDKPVLRFIDSLHITLDIKMWKSEFSGIWKTAAARHNFENLFTGKRTDDTWKEIANPHHQYYRDLYFQPLSSEAKLVTAKEHNGMISSADQNDAVTKFKNGYINTLVATPTLEMGVDLPDLPTVIHRSVPPDPSNYAQRAGRAGRGPKRALVFTYCGFSSHDMTFFDNPLDMSSGEILPPGMPIENTFIIQRHINGLILEAMGMIRSESEPLELKSWNKLIDLSKYFDDQAVKYILSQSNNAAISLQPQDWREIYTKRKSHILNMVKDFISLTETNLWSNLDKDLKYQLSLEIKKSSNIESWPDNFNSELENYKSLLDNYLTEYKKLGNISGLERQQMDEDQQRSYDRAFQRAAYFCKIYLGVGRFFEVPQPISDMATTGFLPNFDFPGTVTSFKGVKLNYQREASELLKYTRASSVALREFAPEQKIYGHGWIYQVERYVSSQSSSLNSAGWGICSNTCTELIKPSTDECPSCHSPVIRIGDTGNALKPELIEIKEAHGSQTRVISDSSSRREMNYFTADLKLIGAPDVDRSLGLESDPDIKMHFHLTSPNHFQIMQIVHRRDKNSGSHMQAALWKEKSEGSSFAVRLNKPQINSENWLPFFPTVISNCPGIRLKIPFYTARDNQWVQGLDGSDSNTYNYFYKTLSATLERAIQKVLRLNKRANNLEIAEHRIMAPQEQNGGTRIESLEILILDNERGGSGLIPMIETYWDQIMNESSYLIKKDCCVKGGCYRCLKSFDNQWDHQFINKNNLLINGSVPLFESLKKDKWKNIEVGRNQATDVRSVPETLFSQWLIDNNIEYKTQQKFTLTTGSDVTISDFEIRHKKRTYQVFIDGWEHHGNSETFLSDIEKRNYLAKRGHNVFWVPGHWPNNKEYVEKIKTMMNNSVSLNIFDAKDSVLKQLPGGIEEYTLHRFRENLSSIFHLIKPLVLSEIEDPRVKILDSALNELKKSFHPFAISEDKMVLFLADDQIISRGKDDWSNWCLMISAVSALNYRPIVVWTGQRISTKKVS